MPTMHFHSCELLLIGYQARNRAIVDARRPNALTTDSIVAIVMAAASTESFIHELAEHIAVHKKGFADWAPDIVTPHMIAFADVIEELEDAKAPVAQKYLIASLVLSGASFQRDAAPFQDFATLIRLRNAIVHMKPATSDEAHQGAKITDALAQRGIAYRPEPNVQMSWFNRLEFPEVARWACDAARAIIVATLALVPEREPIDPVDMLRQQFYSHPGFKEPAPSAGDDPA